MSRRARLRAGGPFSTTTPTERSAHTSTDQVSFYDESLKKQIEGNFVSDGKEIHVSSEYGAKSASYDDLGACIDHNAQILLAQKLLSELARVMQQPGSGLQLEGSSDGVNWTVFYSTNAQGVVGEVVISLARL